MPRPRQRRGADAKKEDKKLKREREEQEARAVEAAAKRAQYRKTEMPWNSLDVASTSTAVVDPDALPEPDADTKAYFKAIADKIQDLEALGNGQGTYGKILVATMDGEEEEELEDERPLLLRSALEELSGHEMALAGDFETSIVLEKLCYSMDDFARRVLVDRFAGNYEKLAKHRSASHVLQTLFTLAGETVDRETRGIVAAAPSTSTTTDSDSVLPTMTSLLLSALSELLSSLPTLLYDPFGSHTVRILLLVFSGSRPTVEGRAGAERSKKSLKWRKGQGSMKSFLSPEDSGSAPEAVKKFRVPDSFGEGLVSMWESLNGLDEGGPKGEGVRRAAMDEVAGPAVRIMIEMEAEETGGWQAGGWADRILCGLVEEINNPETTTEERTEARSEYLGGLLRHPSSSPTFETLLIRGSQPIFKALWHGLFKSKLHRLAGNAVANFVVAVGIGRLDKVDLKETIEEIEGIGSERRGEWIDNLRTGVLRSLLERAATLKVGEKEMNEIMLDTFSLNNPEDQNLVVPCLLSLNRLSYYKKLPEHVTAQPTTQGSVLLQTWLRLAAPHHQVVIDSINSLGVPGIMALTRDATSSRILDSLLSSPSIPKRETRKFLMSLIGHYHELADDRIGSRVVERCWSTADVYLKDKIAASLVDQQNFLQASQFGHFFARKVELPLFQRRREEWKFKMANNGGKVQEKKEVVPLVAEEKKRRERQVDEVDEIFSGAGRGAKRPRGTDTETEQLGRPKIHDPEGMDPSMETVFAALKEAAV